MVRRKINQSATLHIMLLSGAKVPQFPVVLPDQQQQLLTVNPVPIMCCSSHDLMSTQSNIGVIFLCGGYAHNERGEEYLDTVFSLNTEQCISADWGWRQEEHMLNRRTLAGSCVINHIMNYGSHAGTYCRSLGESCMLLVAILERNIYQAWST